MRGHSWGMFEHYLPTAQHYLPAADHRQGIIFSIILSVGALPEVPPQYAAQPCTRLLAMQLGCNLAHAILYLGVA